MKFDKDDEKIKDQVALYILNERINELKASHKAKEERDLELFKQISENQKILSERLLVLETNQEHISEAILKLQKESSIQTKLLTGILLAVVSVVTTYIVKIALGVV